MINLRLLTTGNFNPEGDEGETRPPDWEQLDARGRGQEQAAGKALLGLGGA
jgi:hypothetical protein